MKRAIILFLLVMCQGALLAQDPLRFEEELSKFKGDENTVSKERLILFTGSSSIRLWVDFKSFFPDHNVLNRGFGGSETSDLIYHAKELIYKYEPDQIFIYEGDNDINSGEKPKAIIKEMEQLLEMIAKNTSNPDKPIVLISAKPSPARIHLKKEYLRFNRKLKKLSKKYSNWSYADVWTPMFNDDGSLKEEVFIEDQLHMNKQGYDIWIKAIAPFLIDGRELFPLPKSTNSVKRVFQTANLKKQASKKLFMNIC